MTQRRSLAEQPVRGMTSINPVPRRDEIQCTSGSELVTTPSVQAGERPLRLE